LQRHSSRELALRVFLQHSFAVRLATRELEAESGTRLLLACFRHCAFSDGEALVRQGT
jgi:hypothetical protein